MPVCSCLDARKLPLVARVVLLALMAVVSGAGSAPAGDTELTLAGPAGSGESLELTMVDLESMPQTTIVTENEFSDEAASYRGPLVRDVLAHLALEESEMLRFTAANDYYVDIPASDFRDFNAVLALEVDGKRLSRREKGPIWLMYPISDHSELRSEVYNTRLIWQVVRIEAL